MDNPTLDTKRTVKPVHIGPAHCEALTDAKAKAGSEQSNDVEGSLQLAAQRVKFFHCQIAYLRCAFASATDTTSCIGFRWAGTSPRHIAKSHRSRIIPRMCTLLLGIT